MLVLERVCAGYGDTQVLFDVSLEVRRGESVALLGRNGMGKTTCLLAIMGLNPPRSGAIRFRDRAIAGQAPFRIARMGVGYVPEGRHLFSTLTVLQNLRIPFVNKRSDKRGFNEELDKVFALFPRLRERSEQRAGSLSGGEQQMVALGRAMVGGDELLLLDEPTEGIAPAIVEEIVQAIGVLKREGKTLLVVEQNPHTAFAVSDRAYVMQKGQIALAEATAVLARSPDLLTRYLGVAADPLA
jgi:branched-chain amino acid transport system ATP-binding protein